MSISRAKGLNVLYANIINRIKISFLDSMQQICNPNTVCIYTGNIGVVSVIPSINMWSSDLRRGTCD